MNRNKKKKSFSILLMCIAAIVFSSCIDEDRDDCGDVSIGFDYNYNMLSVNALEGQVNYVALYVFDSNGTLVMKEVSGDRHITNDYAVRTTDLKAGKYKFVAWAKSNHLKADEADFKIPDLTVGASVLKDLTYYLKRTNKTQSHELNNLLVGITEAELHNTSETQQVTVSLKKVNKKIRVVLLPFGGSDELDINNYTFSIVDKIGNGHVNYDYSLLRDEPITYTPYYAANVVPKPSEVLSPNEVQRAAVVEFNTSRLMTREIEVDNPRLSIRSKDTGMEIVSVNLPWFFSLTGMESHKIWGLQEYLDRQDEYVVTLFIDETPGTLPENTWIRTTIIINGWVVNNLEIDM